MSPRTFEDVNKNWQTVNETSPHMWDFPIDRFRRSLKRPSRKLIASLGLNENSKLLEIGCGGAPLVLGAAVLTKAQTYGMDLAEAALQKSKANLDNFKSSFPSIRFETLQGDGFKLPFKDHSLDLILSDGVVEHFPNSDDRIRLFTEAKRCLKPGGFLFTLIPNNEHILTRWWKKIGFPWLSDDSPVREYFVGPRLLQKELEASGLKFIKADAEHAWSSLARFPNWPILRAIAFVLNRLIPLPHFIRLRWGIEAFVLAQKSS